MFLFNIFSQFLANVSQSPATRYTATEQSSKEPGEVEKRLADAKALGIESINSFVNGIRRDLKAVKKAVELNYNNGLAEGSVNKLKVTKRIMYGNRKANQTLEDKERPYPERIWGTPRLQEKIRGCPRGTVRIRNQNSQRGSDRTDGRDTGCQPCCHLGLPKFHKALNNQYNICNPCSRNHPPHNSSECKSVFQMLPNRCQILNKYA